jgi:CDP-diacylglycerol--glycerol-3-phosphate 3-phosphatidyltransferase
MSRLAIMRKSISHYLTRHLVMLLTRAPVSPNSITWLGFILTLGAAVLIITEDFVFAGVVVILAGFLDMVDGALARKTDRVTRFGAILDSTLDRLSEAALLLGMLVLFARQQMVAEAFLAGLTLLGSIMVSYLRARIEGAGLECRVGLFTRAERVIVLSLGLLLTPVSHYALIVALIVVSVLSFITMGQRLFYAYRHAGDA